MADLSHWDCAQRFSALEAVALMQGIEPAQAKSAMHRLDPALKRLREDFEHTKTLLAKEADWFLLLHATEADARGKTLPWPADTRIESEQLRESFTAAHQGGRWRVSRLRQWLDDARASRLEVQTFSRDAIGQWLRRIGVTPHYPFLRQPPGGGNGAAPWHWPWGNHHTEALELLEAAAQRWWARYTPLDRSSAPRTQDVVRWLMQEKRAPAPLAQAIAAILTPKALGGPAPG